MLDYNTGEEPLILKEYGRNIQKLVNYAGTLTDKDKQERTIKAIIDLMGQMNPTYKNVDEFKHKLWDHLYQISNYKLEFDSPHGKPQRSVAETKPEPLPYPRRKLKFKHYGKNVEELIEKAKNMQDEEKKAAFAEIIANYMKMVYQNWNKDNVSDELVKADLERMSEGMVTLPKETNLGFNAPVQKTFVKKRSYQPNSLQGSQGQGQGPSTGQGQNKFRQFNKNRNSNTQQKRSY